MADHSREAVPGDGIYKAFVTSSTTHQMVEDDQDTPPGRGGLVIAALGVVFGDMGDTAGPRDRVVGYGSWALFEPPGQQPQEALGRRPTGGDPNPNA